MHTQRNPTNYRTERAAAPAGWARAAIKFVACPVLVAAACGVLFRAVL